MLRIFKNTGLDYSRNEVLLGDFFLTLMLGGFALAKFTHWSKEASLMTGLAITMFAGCAFIYVFMRPWLRWSED